MLHYVPEHLAPLTGQRNHLLFFPETLYFLQRGSWRKGAPSQPNSAHPEVNGAEGADWRRAPEPSRHTTGWGCRHPPVKRLHPAVLLFSVSSSSFFPLSHPTLQAGSHWNGKKMLNEDEERFACCSKQAEPCPTCALQMLQFLKLDRGGGGSMTGVEWEMSWRGRKLEGVGAQYLEEQGGGVFSRVTLRGRRAAREAGCYGLFSPGVGAMQPRCALPSAPASTWFIAALADTSVHGGVWIQGVCVCMCVCLNVVDA